MLPKPKKVDLSHQTFSPQVKVVWVRDYRLHTIKSVPLWRTSTRSCLDSDHTGVHVGFANTSRVLSRIGIFFLGGGRRGVCRAHKITGHTYSQRMPRAVNLVIITYDVAWCRVHQLIRLTLWQAMWKTPRDVVIKLRDQRSRWVSGRPVLTL